MKRTWLILGAAALALLALAGLNRNQPTALAATEGFRVSARTGAPSGAAYAFVAAESPDIAFAFTPSLPGSGSRPVIAHYFPPLPLTIDKHDPENDYYARVYLRPEGEKGKYAAYGGYLRQRPLPGPRARAQIESDLRVEIARAARIGIDAFGVNLLALDGQSANVMSRLLKAAQETDPRFRIAIEPDMTGLRRVTLEQLADYLLKIAKHPSVLRDSRGLLVVMPFHAESRDPSFWRDLSRRMADAGEPIALIPDFVNPAGFGQYAEVSASVALWGARDASAGTAQRQFGQHAARSGYPSWIATAAPQDMRPKGGFMFEAEGSKSFTTALLAGIEGNASALHLVTWNDYSEATELQPGSATRFAYYDLAAYHIAWFKSGTPPRIERDGFIGFHRKQLFRPGDTSRGKAWRVRGAPAVDIVEMTAFLTAPAELRIVTGGKTFRQNANSGLHRFAVPASLGPVSMRIVRDGTTIAACRSPWVIEARADRHDPIYAGYSSLRSCN
jgi:hypothetical protein